MSPATRLNRRSALTRLAGLGAGCATATLAGCAQYPAEYLHRAITWGDADVGDLARFARRPLAHDAAAPELPEAPEAEAAVAAALQAALTRLRPGAELEPWLAAQGTQGLVLLRQGRIVWERYFNGHSRDALATSFSVAKSMLATVVDQAVAAGELPGLDGPITRWLPELAARDARFGAITLRQLLDMASGIHYRETRFLNGDDARTYYMPDLRRLALEGTAIDGPPGQAWLYNNYHPLLLGLILERATGQRVTNLLGQRLWAPGGFGAGASWSLDSPDAPGRPGFEKLESGVNARVRDFARFGQLFLDEGVALNGRRLLSAEAVRAATSPDGAKSLDSLRAGLCYRHFWWIQRHADGHHDFSARGNFGQFVHVSPREGLVIARNGARYGVPPGVWVQLFEAMAMAVGMVGAGAPTQASG